LRLLGLPEPVKQMLDRGALSAGHARALLAADDAIRLAQTVVKRGLNVRQTERLAQSAGAAARRRVQAAKDADTEALERDLATRLGLAVEIRHAGDGGALVLHYRTLDQLDDLVARLRQPPR
jgi:ParB family chromosome partitioning protein